MMAVALALLLVQGLGAFLIFKAQNERLEAATVNAAAFRLAVAVKGGGPSSERLRHRPGGQREIHRRFRITRTPDSPVRAGEARDGMAEEMLARILSDRDIEAARIAVTYRAIPEDPIAMRRAARRAAYYGQPTHKIDGHLMIAGIQLAKNDQWLVARIWTPNWIRELVIPLIFQTAIIYIVLVTVVVLVMRRITRPLAKLTGRLKQFAQTRDDADQISPEGPDDIRDLIEAHNAMEARIIGLLNEKDVMLGAIGHDLKTPLAALRVRIESISDDAERTKMAATIEDIANSLDDMLSLARVGRPGDPPERVELSALVLSIIEEYEDMGKPVELGRIERVVSTLRPTWLRRALRNLIDNAVRYGGGARVSLKATGKTACVTIEDEGPGIAEDEITSMMDPFTRGDPSRNSTTGGSGLGLALARAIADQHGGSLTLANRPEGGLRAELEIPL